MSSTVIGIFEQESQAQQAKKYLLSNGYDASQVDISARPADYKVDNGLEDNSDRIGNFSKTFSLTIITKRTVTAKPAILAQY
jgi:hypothetical protein